MDDLNENITENYYRFDVLQLLDILREDFSNKRVFFETDPSLAFPPSDISSININDPKLAKVRLPMMNLLGITTPLPIGLTDYATRDRSGSGSLHAFLSIMQNRIHHLWIDVLRKYKIWRDAGNPAMKIFEKLAARSLEDFEVYDLFWLSAFSCKTRSSDGLKRIIQSIWKDIPVRIEENIGRWTTVENRRPLSHGMRLGGCAIVVGSKVFDRTAKFRISLGPVDVDTYTSLLPHSSNYRLLKNILSLYINEPLICELEVSCCQRDLDLARINGPSGKSNGVGGLGRTMVLGRGGDGGKDEVHCYRTVVFEKFVDDR